MLSTCTGPGSRTENYLCDLQPRGRRTFEGREVYMEIGTQFRLVRLRTRRGRCRHTFSVLLSIVCTATGSKTSRRVSGNHRPLYESALSSFEYEANGTVSLLAQCS